MGSSPITAQQESMEDAIAAQVDSANRRDGGRRLLSASELLHLSLTHGMRVDFVDGGLDSLNTRSKSLQRTT